MAISEGIKRQKKVKTAKRIKIAFITTLFIALISLGLYFKYSFVVKEFMAQISDHISKTIGSDFKEITYNGISELTENELNLLIFGDAEQNSKNILSLNIENVKATLEEQGWVESASVKRNINGNIIIDIRESTPMAIWQYQNNLTLLDIHGNEIIKTSLDEKHQLAPYKKLPLVVGAKADENVRSLLRMIHTIPALAEHVTAANWIGQRRWNIEFNNSIIAKLPELQPEKAWEKLFSLQKEKNLLNKKISSIDLRLTDRTSIAIE